MFPTSGYFKNIPCPYFALSVCERPNCHFKHQKPHLVKKSHESAASTSLPKQQRGADGKPTTTKSKRLASYRAAVLPRPHYQHDPFPTGPSTLVYKPTPISELNKTNIPSTDSSQEKLQPGKEVPQKLSPLEDEIIHRPSTHLAKSVTHRVRLSLDSEGGQGDTRSNSDSTEHYLQEEATIEDDKGKGLELIETETSDYSTPAYRPGIEEELISAGSQAKIKRAVTKHEHEEFVDLFGEASDDEVLDESTEGADARVTRSVGDDSDDIVEIPPEEKPPDPVIDLTADTSSDDDEVTGGGGTSAEGDPADIVHQVSRVSIKQEQSRNNTHTTTSSGKSDTKSKHKSKHKHSSKDKSEKQSSSKEKNNSEQSEIIHKKSRHRSKSSGVPVAVSALSEADQCKELFEMFQRTEKQAETQDSSTRPDNSVPESEPSRKRKARDGAEDNSQPVEKKHSMPSARQVMQARFEAMKEAKLKQKSKEPVKLLNGSQKQPTDYNKVAGVTSARTYKGSERKSHQPVSKKVKRSLERPRISPGAKSKVSSGVRQLKLDIIIEECIKIYPDEKDAYDRAQKEEEQAATRAGSRIIYTNLIANIIKKLRDETGGTQSNKICPTVSHDAVLVGKASNKVTVGLKRKNSIHLTKVDMYGDLLFKKLRGYLLTESQLIEQGYPRPAPGKPGQAVVQWSHYDKIPETKDYVRMCKRCGKNFRVNPDGTYVTKEECIYHWGKSFQTRVHGTVDMHFSCCQGKPGAEGCSICVGHVHESNKFEDLSGYMKTFAKKNKDYCGVFSLDCEMVYTTRGLEIARVTVIDDKLNVMFDSFIKPAAEVIDYNTRFSGLTADNFKNVDTSLKDVQAILLDMFQEDTVLIGHSLNSDLVALKLIHDNVVDTSLVWPHKHGLPFKRALKSLMLDILNKLIQEAGSAGHDSSEDACACMELMKWKVHQDFMKDNR